MPTTNQKLLNQFMEQEYEQLRRTMPQRDMLHSAYVTVYHLRRPYLPTPDRFRSLIDEAYHRHLLAEFNHQMHYILPDPLYWYYLDEDEEANMQLEESATCSPSRSLSDLSSYSLSHLFAFVKKNFSPIAFDVFKMAVVEQRSIADIATITGLKKNIIRKMLDQIEQSIRQCRRPAKENRNNPKPHHQ